MRTDKLTRMSNDGIGLGARSEFPVTRWEEPKKWGRGYEWHSFGYRGGKDRMFHPILCECGSYHPACEVKGCRHE